MNHVVALRNVDRDSEILSPRFDESDLGVLCSIRTVIRGAHARGRRVGLCGQAPSDDPAFARFLADAGIDLVSVTPDALPAALGALKSSEALPAPGVRADVH